MWTGSIQTPGHLIMQRPIHPALLATSKLLLSALVAWALAYPFLQPEPIGLAKELSVLGIYGAIFLGLFFLALVALYANDLRKALELVSADNRQAAPRSVWWMLVLPYNFIEDFFIIHAVTVSLRREAQCRGGLGRMKSFGAYTGFGWCVAQIGSLIPNGIGSLFALLALVMWVMHWRLIRKALAALRICRPCVHTTDDRAPSHVL